jgi:hypothetical protein
LDFLLYVRLVLFVRDAVDPGTGVLSIRKHPVSWSSIPQTTRVVRSISLPRIAFSSVITKDGHWLLANSELGKLFIVDLAGGAVAKTFDTPDVPVLPTPGEFALAPDGLHTYVTCPQGGTIEVLNFKDSKMEEPIRLTKGVDGMAWVPSATN